MGNLLGSGKRRTDVLKVRVINMRCEVCSYPSRWLLIIRALCAWPTETLLLPPPCQHAGKEVIGASLCPMVVIRPLLPACVQVVGTTEIREEGRVFFSRKTASSLEKLNDTVVGAKSPLQKW